MLKWIGRLAVVAAVGVAGFVGYGFIAVRDLEVSQLTDDLYVIKANIGGNVAALRTGEGTIIVDTLIRCRRNSCGPRSKR